MDRVVRYKSTADFVTAEIQRRILSRELPPGSKLDQIELSVQLEVSRHPVRQAIERLAERGFIDLHPHRSAVVAAISTADMDDLYRARAVVEVWAVREGWAAYTPAIVREIRDLHTALTAIDPARDLDAYMAANRAFHLAMYQPCGNRHILRTVQSLFDLSERYQRTALQHRTRMDRSEKEHRRMVRAIEERDCERLIEVMERHNEGTQETVRAHIAKPSETGRRARSA